MPADASKPIVVGVTTLSSFTPAAVSGLGATQRQRTRFAAEIRLDWHGDWRRILDSPDWLKERLEYLRRPWGASEYRRPFPLRLIATCRRREDGGQFDGSERQRRRVLQALAPNVDYIDVELGVEIDVWAKKIIRSFHDLAGVPDFPKIARDLTDEPHGIIKIVGTARALSDNLVVRDFLRGAGGHFAAFLMGPYGVPSRLLTHGWGGKLSYHSMDEQLFAPGMIPLRKFTAQYRGHKATPQTKVFGVAGTDVEHSRSPWIHNTWLAARAKNAIYMPLKAVDFEDVRNFAAALPLAGVSVTFPFKEAAAKACASLDTPAAATGACNTIIVRQGRLEGFNTDVAGLSKDIRREFGKSLRGMRALVLGAGGAARVVIHVLSQAGCDVHIWARNIRRARAVAQQLDTQVWPADGKSTTAFGLLVNATPCGMAGQHEGELALPWKTLGKLLKPRAFVYDLVYTPPRTPLLQQAERAGHWIANGWGMLMEQAALQAELFGYKSLQRAGRPAILAKGRVWLIGPRASGKSTLAPILAEMLDCVPTDTDLMVEEMLRRPLSDIFQVLGKRGFRAAETNAMRAILAPAIEIDARARALHMQGSAPAAEDESALSLLRGVHKIIATGGGIVENPDNVRTMRQMGVVIYLDTPEELLIERLTRKPGGRPSLTGKPVHEEVHEILARRRPLYEAAAHITIRADRPPEVLAGEIIDRLAQFEP